MVPNGRARYCAASTTLDRGHAAVHRDDLPGDEGAGVGGEEGGEALQVLGAAHALHRRLVGHRVAEHVHQALGHLRREEARGDGVHVDVVLRPLRGERAREAEPVSEEDIYKRTRERIEKLKQLSYRMSNPAVLNDMEKEPAYKRKNITLTDVPASSELNISRFSLAEDKDNKHELKQNNTFLHDRVD